MLSISYIRSYAFDANSLSVVFLCILETNCLIHFFSVLKIYVIRQLGPFLLYRRKHLRNFLRTTGWMMIM